MNKDMIIKFKKHNLKEKLDKNSEDNMAIANLLTLAINDEWKTINFYNDIISTLESVEKTDIVNMIKDIIAEEQNHVGQLTKSLDLFRPTTKDIDAGEKEAVEQVDELELTESLSDEDKSSLTKELKDKLEKRFYELMRDSQFGFESEEDIKELLMPVFEVTPVEDGRIKAEIRTELGYNSMSALMQSLNPIVQEYDKNAYFDMEDIGIMNAYLEV